MAAQGLTPQHRIQTKGLDTMWCKSLNHDICTDRGVYCSVICSQKHPVFPHQGPSGGGDRSRGAVQQDPGCSLHQGGRGHRHHFLHLLLHQHRQCEANVITGGGLIELFCRWSSVLSDSQFLFSSWIPVVIISFIDFGLQFLPLLTVLPYFINQQSPNPSILCTYSPILSHLF